MEIISDYEGNEETFAILDKSMYMFTENLNDNSIFINVTGICFMEAFR